jgi:transmembrane sensor
VPIVGNDQIYLFYVRVKYSNMEQNPEQLIIRSLAGEATKEEQQVLQTWLAQHAEHQELFDSYSEIWKQRTGNNEFQSLSKSLEVLNHKIDTHQKEQRANTITWPKIAASIVLLIATTVPTYLFITTLNEPAAIVWKERSTPAAQKLTLQLPDGSVAKLNANSSIRFPKTFNPDLREVFCTGEVFFDVVKDSLHPFVVHTHEVTTRVLGTSFNVKESDATIVVTVASGKVSVENANEKQIIHPKEKIVYHKANDEFLTHSANLELDLAWKDNILIFSDTPLNEVAATLESWFGVTISFADARIGNCSLTGKYRNEPLEKILTAISFSTGIRYTRAANNITLSGTGCNPTSKP